MNIYVPIEIQEKFKCLEFRGQPFDFKGRRVIKARHKSTCFTYWYSFNEDFAWLVTNGDSIPDWHLEKI